MGSSPLLFVVVRWHRSKHKDSSESAMATTLPVGFFVYIEPFLSVDALNACHSFAHGRGRWEERRLARDGEGERRCGRRQRKRRNNKEKTSLDSRRNLAGIWRREVGGAAGRSPEARNTTGGTNGRTGERASAGKDQNYPEKLPQRSKYKRRPKRGVNFFEVLKRIRDQLGPILLIKTKILRSYRFEGMS